MKNKFLQFLFVLLFTTISTSAQKVSVDEIVSKHLESIGAATARQKIKNQVAVGTVSYTILRQGGLGLDGRTVIASEDNKFLLGMTFNNPNYPFEKIGYDGDKVRAAFVRPGIRSPLGNFLFTYNNIVEEGLLGGILNSGWSLENIAAKNVRLSFDGRQKVNGKEAYVVNYSPKKGSDVTIKLYFDASDYRHLKTEYTLIKSAQMGATVNDSARQRETRQTLIEEFSDFKKVNNLNLPHSYRVYLALDGQAGTSEYEWKINFPQLYFNQELTAGSFDIEAK